MKQTTCDDWRLEPEDFDEMIEEIESHCTDPALRDLVMHYLDILPGTLWEANCWLDGALEMAGYGTVYQAAIMFIRDRLPETGPLMHVIGSQENYL